MHPVCCRQFRQIKESYRSSLCFFECCCSIHVSEVLQHILQPAAQNTNQWDIDRVEKHDAVSSAQESLTKQLTSVFFFSLDGLQTQFLIVPWWKMHHDIVGQILKKCTITVKQLIEHCKKKIKVQTTNIECYSNNPWWINDATIATASGCQAMYTDDNNCTYLTLITTFLLARALVASCGTLWGRASRKNSSQ